MQSLLEETLGECTAIGSWIVQAGTYEGRDAGLAFSKNNRFGAVGRDYDEFCKTAGCGWMPWATAASNAVMVGKRNVRKKLRSSSQR